FRFLDNGIFKKAAGIANAGRIGQLAVSDINHNIADITDAGLLNTALLQFRFNSAIRSIYNGILLQPERNRRNSVFALKLMLKNTVAVAELALFFCERPLFAAANLNRLQFIKNIHQLYAIRANILYRGCTNPARYQRQIFDTAPALLNGITHRLMPVFARTDL